jgi:hypothetical protein
MSMQNKIDQTKKVALALRDKLGGIEDRHMLLTSEQQEISYASHVERCPKATAHLKAISIELLTLDHERASLTAALVEADARHSQARSDEQKAGERQRARQAQKNDKEGAAEAEHIDALLAELVTAYGFYTEIMGRQAILGAGPGQHQVDVNSRIALQTALMPTRLRIAHLAPRERRTFTQFHVDAYSPRAQGWAAQRLDDKPEQSKEAA